MEIGPGRPSFDYFSIIDFEQENICWIYAILVKKLSILEDNYTPLWKLYHQKTLISIY